MSRRDVEDLIEIAQARALRQNLPLHPSLVRVPNTLPHIQEVTRIPSSRFGLTDRYREGEDENLLQVIQVP